MEAPPARRSVCVTGAGGFIASWLVKLLLSRGHYVVNGTVRDRGDGKNAHLKALENSGERLHLLKADLLDYNSVESAVAGCEGVFHVASPVPPADPSTLRPRFEKILRLKVRYCSKSQKPPASEEKNSPDVIAPAVMGTLNVLKACYEAEVKRVVVVSSVAAVFNNPNWPNVFNEDSWSDGEYCRKNEEIAKPLKIDSGV